MISSRVFTLHILKMALPPKFVGQAFSAGVSPKAVHTVELCMQSSQAGMARVS